MARPSTFKQAVADAICTRLMEGESLRSICEADDMPGQRTVYQWLNDRAEFQQQYARARDAQADTLADQIIDIADDTAHDTSLGKDGAESANSEWISRSRLRVDARKWLAGKLAPKKYGDKVTQEIGGIGGGPVEVNHKIEFIGDD